jgi:hypothetical protein
MSRKYCPDKERKNAAILKERACRKELQADARECNALLQKNLVFAPALLQELKKRVLHETRDPTAAVVTKQEELPKVEETTARDEDELFRTPARKRASSGSLGASSAFGKESQDGDEAGDGSQGLDRRKNK